MKAYISYNSKGDLNISDSPEGLTTYVEVELDLMSYNVFRADLDRYDQNQLSLERLFHDGLKV